MTKNKRRVIKQTIWAAALCLVMGMGIVSFADDTGTVIPASAKIRAAADASSEQVGSVAKGGSVDIIGKTTGADGNVWYQVYVDANTKGYIRSDLIKASGTGTISDITSDTSTTTSDTTSSDQSTTTATATDTRKCMVTTNAKVRKGASTNHDIVATVNKGTTLTVTGEATGTDGKVWYQVSFTYNGKEVTGYIRSDLVTFDGVENDGSVTSEITGEAGVEEAQEEQPQEEQESEDTSSSSQGIMLMNVDETPYILPGFSAVSLSWNDESIQAYSNGGFYLFYARMTNGDEGWYIFDSEKGEYQRYVYTASDTATIPSSSEGVGIIPVIVLIIIIVILAAVIGLLIIKLRDASYTYEYDDDDDEDSDDSDDLKFEQIQPRRQQTTGQPQRRQQGQAPQRQTQLANASVQGQRRQGQPPVARQAGTATVASQGQQRRPQSQQAQSCAGLQGQQRRTQGQQAQSGVASQQRRTQGQQAQSGAVAPQQRRQGQPQRQAASQGQSNAQAQQRQEGYRARTIIENNDDDMDFIDV